MCVCVCGLFSGWRLTNDCGGVECGEADGFDNEDGGAEVGGVEELLRLHRGEESEGSAEGPGGVVAEDEVPL